MVKPRPTEPTAKKPTPKTKRQQRRRALRKVSEAETYEEALANLNKAFDRASAEAAIPAAPQTPTPHAASVTVLPSGNAPTATTEAPPPASEPAKPASSEPAPAAEPASAPAVTPEVVDEEPGELPSFTIDFDELSQVATELVDEQAQKHINAKALTPSKKERLARAFAPALQEWIGADKKGFKATPTDALLITVGTMYAPALLEWLLTDEKPAEATGHVISADFKAAR